MNRCKTLVIVALASGMGYVIGARTLLRTDNQGDPENRACEHNRESLALHSRPGRAHDCRESTADRHSLTATIGALSPDLLRDRISETFSGGYMALLAIIQGVALGALVTTLYSRMSGHTSSAPGLSETNLALQAAGTFVAIIIVTEQYFLFVRLVRWEPVIFDTLAPYAVGLGEVSEAVFLGKNEYWWGSAAVLLLAGSLAFAYTWLRISKDVFGSLPNMYEPFKRSVRRQAIASFITGFGSLILCLASVSHSLLSIPISYQWIYPVCTATTIVGAMLIRYFSLYGMNRWSVRDGIKERINERSKRQPTPK